MMAVLAAAVVFGGYHFRLRPAAAPTSPEVVVAVPELDRRDAVLQDGRVCPLGSSVPFTGSIVEHYPDGTLRSRSAMSNGVLHGLSQGWHPNGQLQIAEVFHHGTSHGVRTRWFADGSRQSEASIVDGHLHGSFRSWHTNGSPAEQAEFVDGRAEGPSLAFFPSGYLKARALVQAGRVLQQQFYKDGEQPP